MDPQPSSNPYTHRKLEKGSITTFPICMAEIYTRAIYVHNPNVDRMGVPRILLATVIMQWTSRNSCPYCGGKHNFHRGVIEVYILDYRCNYFH